MTKANGGAGFDDLKNLTVKLLGDLAKKEPTTKDRNQVLAVEIPSTSFNNEEKEMIVQIISLAFQNQGIVTESICWIEENCDEKQSSKDPKVRLEITFTNESGPKTFKSNIETMKEYSEGITPEGLAAVKPTVSNKGKGFWSTCSELICSISGRGGGNRSAA